MHRTFSIRVCRGPECGDRRGSRAIYDELRRQLDARGLADRVALGWQSCFGRCTQGVNVLVREVTPDDPAPADGSVPARPPRATALYNGVDVVDVEVVIEEHVERGAVVARLVRRSGPFDSLRPVVPLSGLARPSRSDPE